MEWILRHRLYYVLFGLTFYACWFLFKIGGMPEIGQALLSTAVDVTVCMAMMILTVEVLLPVMIYRRRYTLFCACFVIGLIVAGSAIVFTQLTILGSSIFSYQKNIAKYQEHYYYWFWADLIFGSYFLVFFISAAGAAVRFAVDRFKMMHVMEKMENGKIKAELELLKSQVNPHFFFNALNTIYYKIDRSNTAARDTLERFSAMLRYQLYECDQPFIPIEHELKFVSSYVELQKDRLSENYQVKCQGLDNVHGLMISPFLLIPIIENCFKHVSNKGGLHHVRIECRNENCFFFLSAINSIDPGKENRTGGIGLANVRKRLQLLYPLKHDLLIQRTDDLYKLELKIKLHEAAVHDR